MPIIVIIFIIAIDLQIIHIKKLHSISKQLVQEVMAMDDEIVVIVTFLVI
jgi:hypothetical protein